MGVSMLTPERQELILSHLNDRNYVSIGELVERLHFSESTLRRDLKKMEHEQLITCIRGGAIRNSQRTRETPLAQRKRTNHDFKVQIARQAAELVQDNQIIMMDSSTTVMEMVPFLQQKKNLTIITFCLYTAMQIADTLDCTLICTGGKYNASSAGLLGSSSISFVANWFADIMFFSCAYIDEINGLTDQGDDIAQLKTMMLQHSRQAILLADASKFGRTGSYRLRADNISHIITNPDPAFDGPAWTDYRQKMIFTDE